MDLGTHYKDLRGQIGPLEELFHLVVQGRVFDAVAGAYWKLVKDGRGQSYNLHIPPIKTHQDVQDLEAVKRNILSKSVRVGRRVQGSQEQLDEFRVLAAQQ